MPLARIPNQAMVHIVPLHAWVVGLCFRYTVASITGYFSINPNMTLDGTPHHFLAETQGFVHILLTLSPNKNVVTSNKLNMSCLWEIISSLTCESVLKKKLLRRKVYIFSSIYVCISP